MAKLKKPQKNSIKSKKTKAFPHDTFFKAVYDKKDYILDIFRLILTQEEFALFNWNTLKSEFASLVDKEGREKRTDLQFSAQLKNTKHTVRMLFLLEHKSWQDPQVLTQMLNYQAGIYDRTKDPVLPILVYHGKSKFLPGKLEFHEYLSNFTPALRQKFGKNVLNFTPRLLNIQALDIKKQARGLTSSPTLFILQNIWQLDKDKVSEFFKLGRRLSFEKRKFLIEKAVDYIQAYDPTFSWKLLLAAEAKVIKKEEDRVMPPLQYSLDKAREEGEQRGLQKGLLKGEQEGLRIGRQKGLRIGRQEGRQEGHQEGIQKVVLRMLKSGFDIPTVSKCTGLSKAELSKSLKSKNLKNKQ